MLKIIFIRHSKTAGNLQGKYIGRTDEPLCKQGILLLKESVYPAECECVYTSPMKRCVETAALIYPDVATVSVPNFRECDFGDFENKNYRELDGNPAYQAWVDSGGIMQIPGGESTKTFRARCIQAFSEVLKDAQEKKFETIAVVAHGGTLMSILSEYALPEHEFYYWQVKNGRGYVTCLKEDGRLEIRSRLPLLS